SGPPIPSTLVGVLPGIEFLINEKWAVSAGAAIGLFGKSGSFIAIAKRGTCKIHLRLVAQAFQPVQMPVEGRCSINDPQVPR
ncbi:MAG: hypothetical protein Q8L43_04540, partial [Deltaproteobacteria bacterium]|nr:hypothetical protein [Deltaproteobacteria bacterium]